MANAVTLEFCATVSFIVEGVQHHAAGSWQTSKKNAQRDAAQRALVLLTGHWVGYTACGEALTAGNTLPQGTAEKKLEIFCSKILAARGGAPPCIRCERNDGGWQAYITMQLFGVAHTFSGGVCSDKATAREDAATRVLWYLKCPGYVDSFHAGEEAATAKKPEVPPLSEWHRAGHGQNEVTNEMQKRAAEQKTLLMRVQNRLQKTFTQQPGASVWEWSYEFSSDSADKLSRAWVHIPAAGKEFVGGWCQGQKNAQLNTCERVAEFLDSIKAEED